MVVAVGNTSVVLAAHRELLQRLWVHLQWPTHWHWEVCTDVTPILGQKSWGKESFSHLTRLYSRDLEEPRPSDSKIYVLTTSEQMNEWGLMSIPFCRCNARCHMRVVLVQSLGVFVYVTQSLPKVRLPALHTTSIYWTGSHLSLNPNLFNAFSCKSPPSFPGRFTVPIQ